MYYTATVPVYIDQDHNSKIHSQLTTFIYSQVTVPVDCELVTVLGTCAHLQGLQRQRLITPQTDVDLQKQEGTND